MELKYLVLVIYDIVDNRRRNRFVKLIESYLTRVQKSSFEGVLNKSKYDELCLKIERFYKESDNIRIYKITGTSVVKKFPDDELVEEDIIFI